MYESEYYRKVLNLVEDKKTYAQISDPITRLQKENNDIVEELHTKKLYIDKTVKNHLTRHKAMPPPAFMDYRRYIRVCLYAR